MSMQSLHGKWANTTSKRPRLDLRVGMVAQNKDRAWACAWAWLHRTRTARGHGCTEQGPRLGKFFPSGKMYLPIRLFSFVSHTFPLARMCLRALSPRVYSPLSLEGFSHFSKCACCGAIAPFPFSSLAALAPSFYCESVF